MADVVPIHKTQSILDEISDMQNRIMQRAYEIFQENGSMFGRDLDNWLQAEHELQWTPAIELCEKDNEVFLEAAISGVDAKDIDIEVTPDDIVLKADIRHEHNEAKGTVHICEFTPGKLFRSIHLPRKINPDKVKAEFRSGLLRLTAEVAEEARVKKVKPEAA
ncbi:MAG: Hsp20/alpha crystallin family protein [Acidobacteria bacterium]|nr:Hsp20/alpha crystallin family protein [Acidobacteriota bacterium]